MKWAAALALGAALAQPAWAARPGAVPDAPSLGQFWDDAALWLAAGWHTVIAEMTSDRGSHTDPNGATAASESDHGAMSDPNG